MLKPFLMCLALLALSCQSVQKRPSDAVVSTPSVAASEAPAPEVRSNVMKNIQCANDSDQRSIAVIPHESGCRVSYRKHGRSEDVATARNGEQYCLEVQSKIRSNLEAAGFACK